jgi:hypothetical protein
MGRKLLGAVVWRWRWLGSFGRGRGFRRRGRHFGRGWSFRRRYGWRSSDGFSPLALRLALRLGMRKLLESLAESRFRGRWWRRNPQLRQSHVGRQGRRLRGFQQLRQQRQNQQATNDDRSSFPSCSPANAQSHISPSFQRPRFSPQLSKESGPGGAAARFRASTELRQTLVGTGWVPLRTACTFSPEAVGERRPLTAKKLREEGHPTRPYATASRSSAMSFSWSSTQSPGLRE